MRRGGGCPVVQVAGYGEGSVFGALKKKEKHKVQGRNGLVHSRKKVSFFFFVLKMLKLGPFLMLHVSKKKRLLPPFFL